MRRIIKPLYVIVCALNDMLTTTLKERSWVICIIVLVFWPVMSEELGIVVVLGVIVVCVMSLAVEWHNRKTSRRQ